MSIPEVVALKELNKEKSDILAAFQAVEYQFGLLKKYHRNDPWVQRFFILPPEMDKD